MRTRGICTAVFMFLCSVTVESIYGCPSPLDAIARPKPYVWAFLPCGAEVCFDGSQSWASNGWWISSWTWDFGDGSNPRSGTCVRHRYNKVGLYIASLTIWATNGRSWLGDSDYTVVYVADFGMSIAERVLRVGDLTQVTIWSRMPSHPQPSTLRLFLIEAT